MRKYHRRHYLRFAAAALLIAVLALMVRQCSRRQYSPFATEYRKSGGDTLDVAIELIPTIYSVSGDSVSGRDYDILQHISSVHGVPMKFHPFVPLSEAMERLERGDFDMLVASMPLTSDLKERFLMTDPVYLDREVLVQLADSAGRPGITSQIQLGGDTVWVQADSPIASRIANLADEIGDTICVLSDPEYSAEHLIILVALGKIKHAVVNQRIAADMSSEYPQLDISTPVSFTQFQSWAVNASDSALLDSLNRWIKALPQAAD